MQSESESDSESRSSDSVTITAVQPPQTAEMDESTHDVMTSSFGHEMFAKDGEKQEDAEEKEEEEREEEDIGVSSANSTPYWLDLVPSELDAISDVLAARIMSRVVDEVGTSATFYETDSLGNFQRRELINLNSNQSMNDWSVESNWVVGGPHQSPPSWCDWSTFDNPETGIEPDDIERRDFWHLESRSSSSSDSNSECDLEDEVAQKVTIIHFNRSDSAPCKTYKSHITDDHEYRRSQSVPKPHLASLTSSFFGGSSFSILSEGIKVEDTSETFLQEQKTFDVKDSKDLIDYDNDEEEIYTAKAKESESRVVIELKPPDDANENDRIRIDLSHLPTGPPSEQNSRKPSPELDCLYNSLFDNSSNPLSQLFQTTKISPEDTCSEDLSSSLVISADDQPQHRASTSSQTTNQSAVTFTNPTFKKEVNLRLNNFTSRGHVTFPSACQQDKLLAAIPISQAIISPSTFEKLLNEVKEEELQKERSWLCNPLQLSDPSVENSRVFMIRKTQSKIERLSDYDFDSEEDPLESAFKGFSNQLASLTNEDSVEKKPMSVRSLEDFTEFTDKTEDSQAGMKMSKTYKFPLKSVKSVPAFVNPSFLFDRKAAASQSSEDIINQQNLVNQQESICQSEIPGKQFQKSHSVIFPHAISAVTTPSFNWSSLNDLSVPLEKVLAELDQTLKPFVTSTEKLKGATDGTPPGLGFMRRCPSYSNILSHPLLVEDQTAKAKTAVENSVELVELQTSVDSSFAEVTATLQETTSELETLKFDLENKANDLGSKSLRDEKYITYDSTNATIDDDKKDEGDMGITFSRNDGEIDKIENTKILTSEDTLVENSLIKQENGNPNTKDVTPADESTKATESSCDEQNSKASNSNAQIIEENLSEIRPNKSKSEIMRLLSMSRYRDMSPEPIYLEGLKSPCLIEPELDELHFLSDEELREIDLDEDIPPKHLFQFSKKSQTKIETGSQEDYFQYPDKMREVTNKKALNYKYHSDRKGNETAEVSDKNETHSSRRKLPPLPGLETFSIDINKRFEDQEKKSDPVLKSVKQTSRSLELKESSTTTSKNLSLDETKLSQFSSKRQEAKEIINEKIAFPEAMLERFLDLKNPLFGAAERQANLPDKPHLQRRHSSMWKETKRKYNSVDENKFLQRSDSVNCKTSCYVRSYSLDIPDESDDENSQAAKEANFWRHAKTIDHRPSHLFGFVPRNDEDSDDASKNELDRNYCTKLLLKTQGSSFINANMNILQNETTQKAKLTEKVKINEPESCKVETKTWHAITSEDSDDREMVDIFGVKISRSKHYLHQRVKDEIKIVTATKRLRIDEAEEIRMMEAEMAVREKMRKARAQESGKAIGKASSDNTLDISYLKTDHPSMENWNQMKQPSPASSFSQDLMNVLNDITELPLLFERKQSLISSVSSITSSSQSVEAMENSNYVRQSDYDFYGHYDAPRRNPRSRSTTSCYSDSYTGGRTRKETFESRSSQLIYPEGAVIESGVDFLTYTGRQSSYSLPGSRSTSMSRSVNSEINEESYYNNFDYYNKYDPDYDYFVRLQREEQMKQEKLTKLRIEIEKRRKHLQEIMPRHHVTDGWQVEGQYQYPCRPYYNVDWIATDNYGNAMSYGVEECPGIIKPIDYQIKTQVTRPKMSDYRDVPGDRYYGYHQNYGQYFIPQNIAQDNREVQLKPEEQIISNTSRRTPVDLTEILGMTNEHIAREKLNNQISKSRSPAKSPCHPVIQEQNKKPYNGKFVHQQPRSYHRQIHQHHYHHASMYGNGRKMDPLTADTSDSEESLLHCPVTCGSSRDSGVSSGEVAGEMFERSELLAIRSSSGDLLTIQTTPPPHYATGSRKRGGGSCRMGSNVLVDRRLIRQTNSVAVLKNTSLGAPIGEFTSNQGQDELSKKRCKNTGTPTRPIRPDQSQERVTYKEPSDYSIGSYSVEEDGVGKVENQFTPPTYDKLKVIQTRKYAFLTKKILLTADLNDKKFRENGFGLSILGGQKVAWEGNERVTGALVVAIQPGSIADQLNKELQEGDEILEWNGECLRGRSAREVQDIIDSNTPCEVELVIRCGSFGSIRADLDKRSTTTSTICTLDSNLSAPTGTDSFEGLDPDSRHVARSRFKESSSRESCSDVRSELKCSPHSSSSQKKSTTRRRRSPTHQSPVPQTSLESFTNDILALKQSQHEFRKNSLGEIQLQLSYDDFDGTLNVHVIQARNLVPKIKIGYSDPLVKVFLLPYASSTENKRKTKCVPRTLHPEWHQTLMFMHIRREDLPEKTLEVSIWDHDRFMPDQLLGEVLLDLSDISYLDNRPHWYPLEEDCDNRYGRRPRASTASSSSESGGDTSSSGEMDKKHLDERRDKKKSNQKDSSANNSVSSGAKKRGHKSRRSDSFGDENMESYIDQPVDVLRGEGDSRRKVAEEIMQGWSPEKIGTESGHSQGRIKDTHITWTDKRDTRISTTVYEEKPQGQKCNNQHLVGYVRRTFNVVWSSVTCCSRSDSVLKRKQYPSYRNEPQDSEVLV